MRRNLSARAPLLLVALAVVGVGVLAWWWQGGQWPLNAFLPPPTTGTLVPITPILVGRPGNLPEMTPVSQPGQSAVEAPPDEANSVVLNVVPAQAPPGSVVLFEGRGFGPNEIVTLSVTGAAQVSPHVVRAGTDERGTFQLPYQVAAEGGKGRYRVEAVGQTSGQRAEAAFTVADVPTPTPIVIQIETTLATATPEALVTPVALPLYQLKSVLGGVDCAWYGFFGYAYNPDGSPRPDVGIRIFHQAPDGTFVGGTATTNEEGYWEVFLGREVGPDLVGLWHLVVMEGDQRGSAEIALEIPPTCEGEQPTKFRVEWQRTVP